MTHDDEKLLEKILDGTELTDEELSTLSAEDIECNDMLKAVKHVDTNDEPPAHLDSAIRAHARSAVTTKKRPLVVYFRLALTAAAVLLFTLIVIQLLPVKNEDPGKMAIGTPDEEQVVQPDRSKVVKNKISPTVAQDDTVPEFDWESDSITKEMALLEAEIYMDQLDYADAALVENFE